MSKETLPRPNNEEVDLGQLFEAIGKLFKKLYNFIYSIIKFIFSAIIYSSKAIIDNIKIIVLILIVAGVLGFSLEKIMPKKYDSIMLVRTYFDTKYQLHTNLNYYNALLGEENYSTLSNIFEMEEDILKDIVEFELIAGYESENDRIVAYDRFVKSIDSVNAQDVSFDEFIENRGIFAGDLFEIRVQSRNKSIFKHLEGGIYESMNNLYSIKKKELRDSMISIQKQNIMSSIAEIDSLQAVYISVLVKESEATQSSINLSDGFPLQQEKSNTNEFELLNKKIKFRNDLAVLEEEQVEESEFFDVISNFQEVGNKVVDIKERYTFILPLLAFALLCLGYLIKIYIRFVKHYEE